MTSPQTVASGPSPLLGDQAARLPCFRPWTADCLMESTGRLTILHFSARAAPESQAFLEELRRSDEAQDLLRDSFESFLVDIVETPELHELGARWAAPFGVRPEPPLTLVLLPSGAPAFAIGALPVEAPEAASSFCKLLRELVRLRETGNSLEMQAGELRRGVTAAARTGTPLPLEVASLRQALRAQRALFDERWGGFGAAPKEPPLSELLCLTLALRVGEAEDMAPMLYLTLDGMMTGAIYDQLGGGFFATAKDARWTKASPIKRLDDNAALAALYLLAFERTQNAAYRRVARETLEFLVRDLRSPSGGFFQSITYDASAPLALNWTAKQIRRAAPREADVLLSFFDVPDDGAKHELIARRPLAFVAKATGLDVTAVIDLLASGRLALLAERTRHANAEVDDVVPCAGTAELVRSLVLGARILGEPAFLDIAARTLEEIWEPLGKAPGARFSHSGTPYGAAEARDRAALASACLALATASPGEPWKERAAETIQSLLSEFQTPAGGFVPHKLSIPEPLALPMSGADGVRPNALGRVLDCLLTGGALLERPDWASLAERALASSAAEMQLSPGRFASLWSSLLSACRGGRAAFDADFSGPLLQLGVHLSPIRGRASPEATSAWLQACNMPKKQAIAGLHVSALGLGTYRSGLDHSGHRLTLEQALTNGVNIIDTSPNFVWGDSERLVGQVLGYLIATGKLIREQIVVLTKAGIALPTQGDRTVAQASLATEALRAQIQGSLSRLQLEALDLCALEDPGPSPESRREAFLALEGLVLEGKLSAYGYAPGPAHLADSEALARQLRTWASDQALPHLRFIELPLNLVERSFVDSGSPLLAVAAELGLAVLTVRPLQALTDGALLRLTGEAPSGPAPELSSARYRVQALEAEFETRLAPLLRVRKLAGKEAILPMAGPLGKSLEKVETVAQFELAERSIVSPQLVRILASLDRPLTELDERAWNDFRTRYERAVGNYLAAVRTLALDRQAIRLQRVLGPVADKPLAELALQFPLGRAEVCSTFVGLRRPDHLKTAIEATRSACP